MTITADSPRDQYTSGAGDTHFPITFAFELATDVVVYQTPAGQDPDPANDLLPTSAYTVTGAGYGTVNRFITLTTGASINDTITIIRDMPLARTTDFLNSGEFAAADLNNQFDDVVAMIQQVNMKMDKLSLLYVENQILASDGSQNILPKLPPNTGAGTPLWTTNAAGDLVAGTCAEESGCSTLRSEIASDQSGNDGSRIVGFYSATESERTVHDALNALYLSATGNFSTGDVKITYESTAPTGWLLMDDGTIGATNAADHFGVNYKDLYTLLWNNCADAQCPVTGGRGASALSDWGNNKPLRLPQVVGRQCAGAGTAAVAHTFTTDFAAAPEILTLSSTADYQSGMKVQFSSTTTLPAPLTTGTDYWITVNSGTELKVSRATTNPPDPTTATGPANYVNGTYVNLTSDGAGVHTVTVQFTQRVLGEYDGYEDHILTINEIPSHNHNLDYKDVGATGTSEGAVGSIGKIRAVSNTGGSAEHDIMNPVSYVNYMIKL